MHMWFCKRKSYKSMLIADISMQYALIELYVVLRVYLTSREEWFFLRCDLHNEHVFFLSVES